MDQSFHYLLMINQSLFQKKVLTNLMKLDLTPGQPKILDYLQKHNESMQKDIAYGCQIDPATLTGILTRMEEKELVKRHTMNGNRRSSYVCLTNKGMEKSKIVTKIFEEIEQTVFQGIEKNEREQFMNVFYKICCNMTDTGGLQ